jgi:hypothetical protein
MRPPPEMHSIGNSCLKIAAVGYNITDSRPERIQ